MLNLPAYLEKIGHDGPASASREVLESTHERHLSAIPFENVDVRLGRPILRGLGFEVATLEARVRPPGRTSALARTHMLCRVTIENEDWLVDVGIILTPEPGSPLSQTSLPWTGQLIMLALTP